MTIICVIKWQASGVVSVLTSFFGHVIRFYWLVCNKAILCTFLVYPSNGKLHIYNWKNKECHRGTVQCMWGEKMRHHMRWISIVEAGIWSARGVMFWMMDWRAVWWPLKERMCPPPCFRNSGWSQSTAILRVKQFLSTLSNSLWRKHWDHLDHWELLSKD